MDRRPRSDKGSHSLPPEIVGAIEGLALRRPAPTIAFIHRRISDVAYRDRLELVYRRTASRANEQWQCDHTQLDIKIVDAAGTPARPWLTVVLDDYSRAIAGYTVFTGAPTALQTALALHQAVQRKNHPAWPVMGLPDVLYSDHGADFTSTHLERVCLDTHIRLIHSLPGVPQGRGKIERFYRTITDGLLPHLPGFIPHGIMYGKGSQHAARAEVTAGLEEFLGGYPSNVLFTVVGFQEKHQPQQVDHPQKVRHN